MGRLEEFAAKVDRVGRRFLASGQLSSDPAPIIRKHLSGRDCFFMQIGSNDGQTGDPLHDLIKSNPSWRGIFVEPLGYVFERLVQNYDHDKRFIFENIAIADSPGEREFFYIDKSEIGRSGLPDWAAEIGSLNPSHISKHFTDAPTRSLKVRCDTLAGLIARHNIAYVDVLHIDAEGYDYRILSQFDFTRMRPVIVLYEHHHMSASEARSAIELLRSHGYTGFGRFGMDTLALLPWRYRRESQSQ